MKKIDAVVLKETGYIALWTCLFSVVMEAVFLIIGQWNYTVLLGNLLSAVAVILNFLIMGMSVQSAVLKEEKDAKQAMHASALLRNFFLFVVVIIGAVAPIFNLWSTIIPIFFPRIAIALRPYWDKKRQSKEEDTQCK